MHRAPDSPGSSPGYPTRNGVVFTLSDDLEHADSSALSPTGEHHRPQAVFNLDLEYSDDDALLDWEQYSAMNRTGLSRFLPCLPLTPPQWWYTYTRKQRKCMLTVCSAVGVLLLAVLALLLLASLRTRPPPLVGVNKELCAWQHFRLPSLVLPKRYNLTLTVQMEEPWLVEGEVDIELNVTQPGLRCLVLHSDGLHIQDVRLIGGKDKGAVDWRPNEDLQQLTLLFHQEIPSPSAAVHIEFDYPLREGLSGFYRSTYKLADGVERSLATTQFEASAARSAFPCFDEPAMKAVFNVEIMAPPGHTVLFNMPPRAVHHHAAEVSTYHFLPTPPMSTYLLAFIVGNLTSVSRSVPGAAGAAPRNVSIWGTPDRVHDLEFAADTAAAILPAYEAMFGVGYPLPKLDLVAIPDFAAGAMENWGLITYRETTLLVSPTSSIRDYRRVAKVVAHEMAHLWFGDLVTMEYWGELWLNEGFASYLEFAGAQAARPEQAFFDTYYASDVPYALYFDSKQASHPLAVLHEGVNSTEQIESFFDAVSYEKGGAVLRMLRSWVNRSKSRSLSPSGEGGAVQATPKEDAFLQGLQQYLLQYQYRTATSADLWGALAKPLGIADLAKKMQSWTYQKGYPLVTVSTDSQGNVYLHQAPFSLQGASPCDTSSAWWVPVAYFTSDDPGAMKWTELEGCQSAQPLVKLSGQGAWVKVNAGQYGYFRVQYDQPLWAALTAAASSRDKDGKPLLSEVDLAGLLEDSYSLAEAGELNTTVFFGLVSTLPQRSPSEVSAWTVALPYLYKTYRLAGCAGEWKRYMGEQLLGSFLRQQGGASDESSTGMAAFSFAALPGSAWPVPQSQVGYRLLRPTILSAAGYFGNTNVVSQAQNLLSSLEGNPGAPIDPDVRAAIFNTAAHSGDSEIYHQLKQMYKEATAADERERLLSALAHAGPGGHVSSTLAFALSSDVRAQDAPHLIGSTAADASSDSRLQVWRWLKENWGALYTKLGGDSDAARRVGRVAEQVASGFADLSYLKEVDELIQKHQDQLGEAGYAERAKESIRANAKWVERHAGDACSWVQQQLAAAEGRGR